MNNSEDREVVAPQTEKDVPPGFERCNQCRTHNVSPSETSDIENQVKAMTGAHNLLMKNKGFVLLCGCLVILVLIYVLDVFLGNFQCLSICVRQHKRLFHAIFKNLLFWAVVVKR